MDEIRESLKEIKSLASETSKAFSNFSKIIGKTLDDLDKKVDNSTDKIERNIKRVEKTFTDTQKKLKKELIEIQQSAGRIDGGSFTSTFGKTLSSNLLSNLAQTQLGGWISLNEMSSWVSRGNLSGKFAEVDKARESNLASLNKERESLLEQREDLEGKTDEESLKKLARIDDKLKSNELEIKGEDSKAEFGKRAIRQGYLKEGVNSFFKDLGKGFANLINNIYKDTKKMIDDTASYAVSSSYIVNRQAREQMLSLGLSESQNYAFTKTSSLMGISSIEDLYWLNPNQRQLFADLMKKEENIYSTMMSNGTLEDFQKMQIDIKVLKDEFIAEIVKYVVNNKDLIKNIFNTTLDVTRFLMEIAKGMAQITNFLLGRNDEENYATLTSGYNKDTGIVDESALYAYRHSNTDYLSNSSSTTNYQITINQSPTVNGNVNEGDINNMLGSMNEGTRVALASFLNS